MITFFKSIYDTGKPQYITVDEALSRIERGDSLQLVHEIRGIVDKEKRNSVKLNLPCICFSGEFTERKDTALVKHSGFMVLDFDDVGIDFRAKLEQCEYCYACWLSPSGNGFKMLIRIQDAKEHAAHFIAFQKNEFPECDSSGKNISRICFESYDPEIHINKSAKVYTKIFKETFSTVATYSDKTVSVEDSFKNLIKWLTNKNNVFASGNRNNYIFTLASACCRYGIFEADAVNLIGNEYLTGDTTFTKSEAERTVKSAYKANTFGTCTFDKSYNLITTKSGIEIDLSEIEDNTPVKDIIYSDDAKEDALRILMNGYEAAEETGVEGLDFRLRKGDVTLLSGIGNYGKSTLLNYIMQVKSIKDGDKWCIFTPETNPAAVFYHEHVEILKGRRLDGGITHGMSNDEYIKAYDWIGKHFFYCYPKENDHTPEYILERFLEMVIKEKVKGVVIDPFNKMSNDTKADGYRDDKYLARVISMFSRFAKENNIFFIIVAHPKIVQKSDNKIDYLCPQVFDISGGAMWNNMMDNILMFHRPFYQSDAQNQLAEFHKKKIRYKKQVGEVGMIELQYEPTKRRFYINGTDWLQYQIDKRKGLNVEAYAAKPQTEGLYEKPPF